MVEVEPTPEVNAVEAPLYTVWDAARYLHIPVWFASVAFGRAYGPYSFDHHIEWSEVDSGTVDERVSFRSIATLFVMSGLLRAKSLAHPRLHSYPTVGLQLWEFARSVVNTPNDDVSSAETVMGKLRRHFGGIVDADMAKFEKITAFRRSRIESRAGVPVRLFPFSRDPAADSPRVVVIDPAIRFGRPTVQGVPTDVIVERWRAGDTVLELADDYGLTAEAVEEALRYESLPRTITSCPHPDFAW